MSITHTGKQIVKRVLASRGYALTKRRASMEDALHRIVQRRIPITTVIDIGASDGRWSAQMMQYYPRATYLLVEAQPVHVSALQTFQAQHTNVQTVLKAAGESQGEIYFDAGDPLGGQASYTPLPANNIVVPVTTVDHEIAVRNLSGPFLLKTDTHGFEAPILKGAETTLSATDIIIMECYNFKIAPQCLLFHEMCAYLQDRGFRCADLVDISHRPHDATLWQMDMVFIRANRPEFGYIHYY